MVGGDSPEIDAAQQQQQQCPLMAPTLDLPPACHLQTCTAKHVPAMTFDRAAAVLER